MALLKSKYGNTTYSWKSDDVRDAEIKAITEVYGSKNLLNILWSEESLKGAIATYNDDGSITINGAPSGGNGFINLYCDVPEGSRIFSGISEGSASTYHVNIMYSDNTWDTALFNGEALCTKNNLRITRYTILISDGYNCNNITFYPMIRDSRILDNDYIKHIMTNRELMEKVTPTSVTVVSSENETWSQILSRLYDLVDWSKVTNQSTIEVIAGNGTGYRSIFRIEYYTPANGTGVNYIATGFTSVNSQIVARVSRISMHPSFIRDQLTGSTYEDLSSWNIGGDSLKLTY